MDFHTLSRRDLQALCKRNKIPANITNVAMADSLKALEFVEGIEEFVQSYDSETAQSSIESPVRSEVTSPYVPPTGGRSTRRRNVAKEPETAKPSARAQHTARRTVAKNGDETPAVVPQSNRRKGEIASACRKMDSELKECMDEEKKDVLVTPAPSNLASRRRRGAKEESVVKPPVYSTRRSVRLAKKNVELLNENTDFSKKDLFANDCQDLNTSLKEGSDDSDEMSIVTGVVDTDITVEEKSEKMDEAEVVSAEKQDILPVNDTGYVPKTEKETEEVGYGSEVKAQVEMEKCAETLDENKVQENDGSLDVQTSEIEMEVEKIEQQNEDVIAKMNEYSEDVKMNEEEELETKDNFVIGEVVSCDTGILHNEIENVGHNNIVKDEILEINVDDVHEDSGEKELNNDQSVSITVEAATEEPTKASYQSTDDSWAEEMPLDISLMSEDDEASKWDAVFAYVNEKKHDSVEEKDETNVVKGTELEMQQSTNDDAVKAIESTTPSAKKKIMTVVSDNKENIDNNGGSSLVVMKERVVIVAKQIEDKSLTQLRKMLKEKLQITNQSSKNENENEVPAARPALQALPENR